MRTPLLLLLLLLVGLYDVGDATDNLFNGRRVPVDFHITPLHWQNLNSMEFHVVDDPIYAWIGSFELESSLGRIGSSTNQTTACQADLDMLIRAASQQELWALKVFDAWGKPLPSGLLNGNIFLLGNYDECINPLYQEQNHSFLHQPIDTQYCALQSVLSEPVEVRSGLTLGLCLPASCNRRAIIHLLQNISELQNLTTDHVHCSNDRSNEGDSHRTGTIAFLVVLSLLIITVLIGTIADIALMMFDQTKINDVFENTSNEGMSIELLQPPRSWLIRKMPFVKFIGEFSALRTLQRIFVTSKIKNDNILSFLDGLRVLSLFWVILGHSFSSGIYFAANINDMQSARRNLIVHLVTSGAFAVDTFFVLSGFLTAILFVRQVQREKLSVRFLVLYYVHRYLRLTPAFILTMFASIYLTPYFGRGPLYPIIQGFEPRQCRDGNWWTAFLYIGNFLKSDDLCLGITWYLYNDMQFYWIAPLALIPFVKGKRFVAYLMTSIFFLVSIASVLALLLYYPNLVDAALGITTNATGPVFFDKVYMAPWCRIAPYGSGMLTGFLISSVGRRYRLNRRIKIIGYLSSIVFAALCLFSNYIDFISPSDASHTFMIIYQTLSRPLWSLSIAWIIVVCSLNQGGIINRILSFSFWTPLARLNYAAYLIHMTVILISVFNQSNPLYYQFMPCLHNYVSQLIFAYLAAILIVIFFEAPFFVLEKKILKR